MHVQPTGPGEVPASRTRRARRRISAFAAVAALGAALACVGPAEPASAGPYLDASTFSLHSRPGSKRTIYLDFDGGTFTDTFRNDFLQIPSATLAPWTEDTDTTTFNASERSVIQNVWQRVSEDYAPLDIDVTTEAPPVDAIDRTSLSDDRYGAHVVLSAGSGNFPMGGCNCSGLATRGAFDRVPDSNQNASYHHQAWVITNGPGSAGIPKNFADITSHEVGHLLGLAHDGQGSTAYYAGTGPWAPLLGLGGFGALSQFSNGDYTNASNLEDDFAVMATNGGVLVTDDHADTATGATAISRGQTLDGLITTRTDLDAFTLTPGAAPATITVETAPVGPNLDVELTVTNLSTGAVTKHATPDTVIDTGVPFGKVMAGTGASVTLPASTSSFLVQVDGVREPDPGTVGESDYGSRGRYTVTFSTTPGAGKALGTGNDIHQQLGNPSIGSSTSRPTEVSGLGLVRSIAPGSGTTIAAADDGTVWAWGQNDYGELGQGTASSAEAPTPIQVPGLQDVVAVASGVQSAYALDASGTVWAWGRNNIGQLGLGTTTTVTSPTPVPGLTGVAEIVPGSFAAYARKTDGTVWAWGRGSSYALGNGSSTNRLVPTQVTGLTGITAISATDRTGYALKPDGTVLAWGNNTAGQVGDGTTTSRSTAVPVTGLSGVTAISHGYALKSDGTVWAWGRNASGELGNGGTADSSVPAPIPGLANIRSISGSYTYDRSGFAVSLDGRILAWGANGYGQLGLGTTTNQLTPATVTAVAGVASVVTGAETTFVVS